MGSNAIVLDFDTKEYIWLGKHFYPSKDENVLHDDMQLPILNSLLRFLHEHQNHNIQYGFAQHLHEFLEDYAYHQGELYNRDMADGYTELSYSKGT